ncbi:hypothetical protein T439DRAFT_355391 [Meredithblackwellia eburnea MCA 4105]
MFFSSTVSLLSLATLALGQTAATTGATINTPTSLVECQPASLTWSGGSAPYWVSIVRGNSNGKDILFQFPSTQSTSVTWIVNMTAGTNVGLGIRDKSGTLNYSDAVTVQNGTSSDCIGKDNSSDNSSTDVATTTAKGGKTTAAATTKGVSTSANVTTTSSTGTSSSSGTGSSTSMPAAQTSTTTSHSGASAIRVAGGALALVASLFVFVA